MKLQQLKINVLSFRARMLLSSILFQSQHFHPFHNYALEDFDTNAWMHRICYMANAVFFKNNLSFYMDRQIYIHTQLIRVNLLGQNHIHQVVVLVRNSFQCYLFPNETRKQMNLLKLDTILLMISF